MSKIVTSIVHAKAEARRLRQALLDEGKSIAHSHSLELIARRAGYRDWNTLSAKLKEDGGEVFRPGDRVRGHFLSQPFVGTVLRATQMEPGWTALVLEFDEAVDVVTFDSFSNFRKRVRGVVGPAGHSRERTSNGRAHLEVDL